jgi:DNA repair protein SbcD/Mre11
MKFIHTADIHLDSPLVGLERYEGAPVEEIRGATRQALDNLVQLAIDEKASFVVIAGDLYDGDWKDYNTGLYLSRKMSELKEGNIKVYVVTGNHDAASRITKQLSMPNNVRILKDKKPETITDDDLGIAVHGQSYQRHDITDNLADKYPAGLPDYFNIGLLHTCLTGREGHEPYAPCSQDDLKAKKYQYWALGHAHRYEVVSKDPWIVFSGNLQGRSVRETGAKGCVVVTVEDGDVVSASPVELDVMRWVVLDVDVGKAASCTDIVELVGEAIDKRQSEEPDKLMAIRVKLQGAFPAHGDLVNNRERWINEIRARATDVSTEKVWLEKVIIETENRAKLDELLCGEDALAGLVKQVMELGADQEMLDAIVNDFEELKQKMPSELLEGEGRIDLESPDTYLNMIEDVKNIIVDRILSGGTQVEDN